MAGRPALLGWEIERGRPLAGRGRASKAREASRRSEREERRRSDDTGAWFERRLREPSFVIPEISDFRRQRGAAREREGAFGNAVITADVRYFLVTKHYPSESAADSSRRRTASRSTVPEAVRGSSAANPTVLGRL